MKSPLIAGAVVGVVGAALVACFPSLDSVAGTGQQDPGAGASSSSSSSSSGNGGDSSTTSEGGTGPNTGVDGGGSDSSSGGTKPTIKCGQSTSCNVGPSYCCVGFGATSSCTPAAEFTSCAAAMFCDENKDCGPSMKCCISAGRADCRSTCDGIIEDIVCNPDAPDCPSSLKCQSEISGGGMTLFICK